MSVYQFMMDNIKGEPVSLATYKGKVLVIVNTASACGLTPQYEGLQALYEKYREQGLEILGFPCNQFGEQEPGQNNEVESFCKLNYGVTFPLFAKSDVRGETASQLFRYLSEAAPYQGPDATDNDPKWNFTKFVIDREGAVVARFEPRETPESMEATIEELLKK